MAGPGKTQKKRSTRPASLTEAHKRVQAKARERKALKRLGRAAQLRIARRAFLAEKRKEDPNYARPIERAYEVVHQALNSNDRGRDQLIYSCVIFYK